MAAQVAYPPHLEPEQQPLWYASSSPIYPPSQRVSGRMPSMYAPPPPPPPPQQQQQQRASQRVSTLPQRASQRASTLQQQQQLQPRASVIPQEEDNGAWGGEYARYSQFPKLEEQQQQQQQQQEEAQLGAPSSTEEEQPSDASSSSTPESSESSGGSGEGSSANGDGFQMPAQKSNRKALRKLTRLVKKRGKEIAIITVFNSEGTILCSLPGAQAGQEHTYEPTVDEGTYLRLALERGFKKQGCEFDFGGTVWLSGQQEEIDDKQTMLGNESTPEFRHHRFYSVLSPTGRYVVAAVLKEGEGGQLNAKLLRKIRTTADNFEVYEAWAGSGKLMAKLACAA